MDRTLRRLAIFIGFGLLFVSIFWSQDGFNFNLAGVSGYGTMAMVVGWFMAISVTVIQFVFSTSYSELNASLKFFGILAYVYSIYTNYWGILAFQGISNGTTDIQWGAGLLALVMDGIPEPLIAWGLYESLTGDFIGNLIKTLTGEEERPQQRKSSPTQVRRVQTQHRPDPIQSLPKKNGNQTKVHREPIRTDMNEPTYHTIQLVEEPDVPDFLKKNRR